MVGIQRHFNAVKSETSEKTNFIKLFSLKYFGFVVADVSDLTASPFCWRIKCREKNVAVCCLLPHGGGVGHPNRKPPQQTGCEGAYWRSCICLETVSSVVLQQGLHHQLEVSNQSML